MIKHTIFAGLIGLIIFGVYLTTYVGAFRAVKISEGEAPAFILLGKEHVGPYHKIVADIQEVETWAKAHGVDCSQSFGLYLNDPRNTEEERLRSWGGCWVSNPDIKDLPEGFKIQTWTAPYFVKAVFDGSPGIGPMKVYPQVEDYMNEKQMKRRPNTLEVYVIHPGNEMTTTYYFPVEKPATP